MENSSREDYRIQSFDPDTQILLKKALKGLHFTKLYCSLYWIYKR